MPAVPLAAAVVLRCLQQGLTTPRRCYCCVRLSPSRQGHLNVPSEMPWKELEGSTIGRPEHLRAAYDLAVKGTVLLKNAVSV